MHKRERSRRYGLNYSNSILEGGREGGMIRYTVSILFAEC